MDGLELELTDVFKTRSTFVADKLREAILNGRITPGTKLVQEKIAESLNVSRIPVREAIQILASEGLVQIRPQRGAIVSELSPVELREIYFLRMMLEGMAARLAAPNMIDVKIMELESILKNLYKAEKFDIWIRYNKQFHHTIYLAANRTRLLSIIINLRNTSASCIRRYIDTPKHRVEANNDHQRIFEACKARDGDRAERETKKHLNSVLDGVLANMQSNLSQS